MKNENLNSKESVHITTEKVVILQRILTSLAVLNNRYQRGFTFIIVATDKSFFSSITIKCYNKLSCSINDIDNTDAYNKLKNYAYDLESKINE